MKTSKKGNNVQTKIEYEHIQKHFKGEVTDKLIDAKTGKVLMEQTYHNLVVDSCSILIAGLMKGSLPNGIQYFAVGTGLSSWQNENLPEPDEKDTKLLNELYRKEITEDDIMFIDSSNVESKTPTNRLQISVTFNENEANGELRELGIFGGGATSKKDSGYMLNRKIHALICKTSGMKLERVLRFTF